MVADKAIHRSLREGLFSGARPAPASVTRAALVLAALVGLWALTFGPAVDASEPDVQDVIDRLDRLYRSEASYAEVEMAIVTPNWERTLRMQMWTEGMQKTLITILSPKKEKGIATLRIGTEMWNYFPKINKVMKVPPSMMMGLWMGSDFTNDDVVKESSLIRDYECELEDPGRDDVYRIALTPRQDTPTVWGKIVYTVRRADLIPLEEVFYDEDGEPMRAMIFWDVKTLGGRSLPAVLEMVPLNKEGHKTVIRYLDARFDADLGTDVFTLRKLRGRR